MNRSSAVLRCCRVLALLACLSVTLPVAAAADAGARRFNLPADRAEVALKLFATQSGMEVLFSSDSVADIRTARVQGEMPPAEALQRLLAGTALTARQEPGSGIFLIRRTDPVADPKANAAPRADPAPARSAASSPGATPAGEQELVRLSPFEVSTERDTGYAATETLSGTRLRSSVNDVAADLTILTRQFLADVGADSFEEALIYVPNTDTYQSGVISAPDGAGPREKNLYNVRGFRVSSITRDFFSTPYPPDTYNTERLTFDRGPNSVLFGIGEAGGIADAQSKRARYEAVRQISNRVDDNGSLRGVFDYNQPLLPQVLAIRIAGLYDDKRSWLAHDYVRDRRLYGAVNYKPFNRAKGGWFRNLEFNTNLETGNREMHQLGRNEPIYDGVTPWIEAGRPIVSTIGVTTNANAPRGTLSVANANYLVVAEHGPVPGSQVPTLNWRRMAVGANPSPADSDQSGSKSLLDQSLFPFDVNYLGGGRRFRESFRNFNVSVDQTIARNLHFQAAYNHVYDSAPSWDEARGRQLNVDVNAFLPNGRPNPNVGRYYMESAIVRNEAIAQATQDAYRLSLSYALDFSKRTDRFRHLGRLVALGSYEYVGSRNQIQLVQLSNLTPALTNRLQNSNFPALITNPQNRLKSRQYLDPAGGHNAGRGISEYYPGPFYAGDRIPADLADAQGVTLGMIADVPGSITLNQTRSRSAVLQSFLLQDRLIATLGMRKDTQQQWDAAAQIAAGMDPVTGLYPYPMGYDPKAEAGNLLAIRGGSTRTLGLVGRPLKWVDAFYNRSDNFRPSGSQRDIFNEPHPDQTGKGENHGLRFRLFEQKLSASISWFRTSQNNIADGFIRAGARGIANAFNLTQAALWDAVAAATGDNRYLQPPYGSPTWQAIQSTSSKGYEIQVVYNPTSELTMMFNYSTQGSEFVNVAPRIHQYFTEFVPSVWQPAWNGFPLVTTTVFATGTVSTAGQMLAAAQADARRIKKLEGATDSRQSRESFNLVATHTFRKASRLRGWAMGGTVRWRGDRGIGFPFAADGVSPETSRPYLGGNYTTVDGMIRYQRRLFDRFRWAVQLNVRNLLDETSLLPVQTDGLGTGKVVRWGFQAPRSYVLTNTFTF